MSYAQRQCAAIEAHGPVCVGIDPHPHLLRAWGLNDDVASLRVFSLTVVSALHADVAAFKPQSALFERFGSAGIAVLEEVLDAIRSHNALSIMDVKRGDIGSTMQAYAETYAGETSPLRADAFTCSPYLGIESLSSTLDYVHERGRGMYILALTSNPHALDLQQYTAPMITTWVRERNAHYGEPGPAGLVVGATVGDAPQRLGLDLPRFNGLILAPGIGAQGAGRTELAQVFGAQRVHVLASASRSVLKAGPGAEDMRSAVRTMVEIVSEMSA